MRTIIMATACALICVKAKADSFASRSDSIDILHTAIDLDLTDADIGLIHAHTTLTFTPKVSNINALPLDLMALTVDSVTMDGSQLSFAQAGETLTIQLGAAFGPGDTLQLTVHYGGDPATDNGGSGFGGFYTGTIYQYAIGVALDHEPHSYGRSWFPCFDNFVERCTFEFTVLSEGGRAVFANGLQTSVTDLGGGLRSTHWTMQGSINAYMATVSAANYPALVDTFPSITGADVPVTLAGLPADTADMRASFGHLHEMFDFFEDRFGPYRWDRVGFVLTPVGAMEHPTNVNFPVSTVDGTFNDERRISHELSHHWFGDLATCDRAEEMYINEGFAEFCSYYFVDHFYGHADYMELVRDNHRHMVHQCHLQDEGWWPLSEVPQDWTYGVTPYYKGADIAHTLRSYLGDSLFSAGFTSFFDAYAFRPVNSVEMRDALATATGVDLTDFFNDWIFQSGWAAFEVDSFQVVQTFPNWDITAFIEQKLRGPATYYHNVPVSIHASDLFGEQFVGTFMVGGQYDQVTFTLPFIPEQVRLDQDERLSLAITQDRDTITTTGIKNYMHADLRLTVNTLPSPADLIMQEYWVAADDNAQDAFAYVVSPDRWWRISGSLPFGSDVEGRITFDGRPTISGSIDLGLVQDFGGTAFHEDSVVVLYRPDAHFPWLEVADFTVSTLGSATDGFGRVDFSNFSIGDYTLGWRKSAVGIHKPGQIVHDGWVIYPNPATDRITVEWRGKAPAPSGIVQVLDSAGREIGTKAVVREKRVQIDQLDGASGDLILQFMEDDGTVWPIGTATIVH